MARLRLIRPPAVAAATPPGASFPVAPITWLYLAAGLLGLISVVLPHDPETVEAGVVVISLLALAVAAVLQPLRARLGARSLSGLLLLGTALTSAAILCTAGVPNASATLYTWICLYAFYALPRSWALGHIATIAAVYAGIIVADPPPFPPVAHWTTTIGTLLGAGILVGALRDRLDLVIGRLADTARRDPLTALVNRRGFREQVDAELVRAARTRRSLALVLVDIDRFKQINDRLGHVAGDEVLRGFATALADMVRATDVTARLGGEEFGLLLPETTADEAVALVERLRRALPDRVSSDGHVLTASFGVATWPQDGPTHEALMHNADRALYAAKRGGRDRVVRYQPGTMDHVALDAPVAADPPIGVRTGYGSGAYASN